MDEKKKLLDGLCDETYRARVAQLFLIQMGHDKNLGEKPTDGQGGMQQSTDAVTHLWLPSMMYRRSSSRSSSNDTTRGSCISSGAL